LILKLGLTCPQNRRFTHQGNQGTAAARARAPRICHDEKAAQTTYESRRRFIAYCTADDRLLVIMDMLDHDVKAAKEYPAN